MRVRHGATHELRGSSASGWYVRRWCRVRCGAKRRIHELGRLTAARVEGLVWCGAWHVLDDSANRARLATVQVGVGGEMVLDTWVRCRGC